MSKQRAIESCFDDTCRAAASGNRPLLRTSLDRLRSLKLDLTDEALRDIEFQQTVGKPIARPSLLDQLPPWIKNTIKNRGLQVGKDIFLKPGPGTVGVTIEFRFR